MLPLALTDTNVVAALFCHSARLAVWEAAPRTIKPVVPAAFETMPSVAGVEDGAIVLGVIVPIPTLPFSLIIILVALKPDVATALNVPLNGDVYVSKT